MDNTNTPPQNDSAAERTPAENSAAGEHTPVTAENVTEQSSLETAVASRRRIIKIVLLVAIVIAVLAFLFSIKQFFVAAIVNGHPISRFAVIGELEKQSGKAALDNMIDKQLIQQEAQSKNITVSDDEINAEIKKLEEQYTVGTTTLDTVLQANGLTRADLKDQVRIRKEIEKLVGDKANVTDDEVQKYITDNKVNIPTGQEDQTKSAVKESLVQQKLASASQDLLTDLRSKAKIRTFVNYPDAGGSAE